MSANERVNFGSKIGIILASAGSAVGLGNIWRFPCEVGENGGAAFYFGLYPVCDVSGHTGDGFRVSYRSPFAGQYGRSIRSVGTGHTLEMGRYDGSNGCFFLSWDIMA